MNIYKNDSFSFLRPYASGSGTRRASCEDTIGDKIMRTWVLLGFAVALSVSELYALSCDLSECLHINNLETLIGLQSDSLRKRMITLSLNYPSGLAPCINRVTSASQPSFLL